MAIAKCMIKKAQPEFNLNDALFAAKALNGATFKLYMYLCSFPKEETLYEKKNFIKLLNTTNKTADQSFQELIEKNYLIPKNNLNYIFTQTGENAIEEG